MSHKSVKACSVCGEEKLLVKQRTLCRECNLKRKRAVSAAAQATPHGREYNRTTTAAYRQTPRGRAGLLLWFAAKRAKLSGLEFSLLWEPVAAEIERGNCAVTGLPFDLKPGPDKHHANPWAPSLDRRDSSKGYTPDNVQVVVAAYNYAKSEWSEDVLLRLARAIVDASSKSGV
jgi:hypothetical protein